MLMPGHGGNNIGDSLVAESSLLAIQCDFSHPIRQFNIGFCVYHTSSACDKCAITWSPN